MHYLKDEFQRLLGFDQSSDNAIPVVQLPGMRHHKIGISEFRCPIFFVSCEINDQYSEIDCNLDLIKIEYNRKCYLICENQGRIEGIYTIISLKPCPLDAIQYFLDSLFLILTNLPEKTPVKQLKGEIEKLIALFNSLTEAPIKTIQGLWGELFVIQRSKKPEYLIKSWHVKVHDKFDFSDGVDKIEVKSTTRNRRIHNFSLEQLTPNNSSQLMIVSILVYQSGIGVNVFDLMELIESKGVGTESSFTLREKVALCLGDSFERAQDVYFDYNYAVDNMQFYHGNDIPKIEKAMIPNCIDNISFNCDLSGVNSINRKFSTELHRSVL